MNETQKMAQQIRLDCVKMTNIGKSGHIGSMLSMADIIAVMYDKILNVKADDPKNPERDRFILSKGHAGAAVYSALSQKGFFPREWLNRYYVDDGKLMGHISHKVPGVEFSTGSLGHGLPVATGMAIAARYAGSKRRVFIVTSDGDMNEGSSWEAVMFAAQEHLSNLTMIIDYNQVQALGFSKNIEDLTPLKQRLELFGWSVKEIDGHNTDEIEKTLKEVPFDGNRPSAIIAHTIKCKGIKRLENTVESHYQYIHDDEIDKVLAELKEND